MTEQEELEILKQKSPYALPDNPSQSGWSTDQIKRKHYEGLFFLYDLFKQQRTTIASDVAAMQLIIDNINDEYAAIISGEPVKAKYDIDNNEIKNTYAKILDITNGTIGALKYIKENNTTAFIYTIEDNLNTLTTAFNSLKLWTDALRNENGNEAVLRAVQATKDSLGNVIKDTYATVTSVTLLNTAITNIINGTTTVSKAYNDQNGDRIDTTYLKIANIVNALNDTSTNKALSAAKGKALQDEIDAINTLLASDTTTLDTLQEIVDYIKNNKDLIDGITISKMSFTDLVKNLTTNNDNLPLAASQGYALKGMIDAINDVEDGIEAAEALRVIAENARVLAEETRAAFYEGFNTALNGKEDKTNKVTSLSSSSTDTEYPSAKVVYDGLALKANQATTYTKTENDAQLDLKADKSTTYTKTETDTLVNGAKTYTDKKIKKMYMDLGHNDISTSDYEGLAYQITAPSGAKLLQLQSIGGNTVKLSPSVASDSTKAMIKTMPSTVYTFDGSKFYGDSKKSNNLSHSSNTTITSNVANNYDSFISISGLNLVSGQAYTISFTNNNTLASGVRYYITGDNNNIGYTYTGANSSKTSYSMTFTPTGNESIIRVRLQYNEDNTKNTGTTTNVMLNVGSSALPYEEGFTNIRNVELTGLKVEGANLFSIATTSNSNFEYNADTCYFKLLKSAQYIALPTDITLEAGTYTIYRSSSANQLYLYELSTNNVITAMNGTTSATFTLTKTTTIHSFASWNGLWEGNIAIVRGSSALTSYDKYITPTTKTIDLSTIEDSNNNKLFPNGKLMGNENVKDVLGVYNQESKWNEVDMGTLNWTYNAETKRFETVSLSVVLKPISSSSIVGNLVCSLYETTSGQNQYDDITLDMTISEGTTNYPTVSVRNLNYTDATAFKTAMSGVMLQYERATYLTSNTDLSATLRNIQGYQNGSIIAENTNNMDVESVITYNSIIQETLVTSVKHYASDNTLKETRTLPYTTSDGYSAGSSRNYRVFCDDEGNEVLKRETNVDKGNLGSLNYDLTISSSRNIFRTHLTTIKSVASQSAIINALSSIYNAVSINATWVDKDMSFWEVNSDYIALVNNDYNDITTLKTAMTNEPLYYELADASKTETTIDDFDYFFDVEEGDYFILDNQYNQQCYATYSFLIKEAKSNE